MGRRRSAGRRQASAPLDGATVLKILQQSNRPLKGPELLRLLHAHRADRKTVTKVLDQLIGDGKVVLLRGGAFGLTEHLHLITGELEVQRSGVGFLLPDDKRRRDVFIHPSHFGDAGHGDRVVVALFPARGGRSPEGRVVRILARGVERMAARVERRVGKDLYLCRPTDPRQPVRLMVEAGDLDDRPAPGQIVLAAPGERLDDGLWAARAEALWGDEGDPSVQEALVKENYGIPTEFPAEALAEAAVLPEGPGEEDAQGRTDLRGLDLVTIDGVKARDFDDAIFVRRESDGWRLWVAIADVAHYVRAGSALDRTARERGNSCYFPQSVEPMFPEALSNGLCSLNPDVDRLAMTAELRFSRDGAVLGARFYPALIRSKARLTYDQVNRALFLGDEAERNALGSLLPMLQEAEGLARALLARRRERGSLDFDLPEPEILFNLHGETVDIRPSVRHFGHQIIEECMIAANEAVARFLTARGLPCLYRIHEDPDGDKLAALFKLLRGTTLAWSAPSETSPQALQSLLVAAEGTDQEFLVSRLVLRAMMQAKYAPELRGHFGLASDCYCHFTSPIRRYADLVVHRSLKQALGETPQEPAARPAGLKWLGEHLSRLERTAMEAEREILKRLTVLFLQDRVGEVFSGVISSLSDFGFWVELTEVMAEGLVRLSTLDDDYYGLIPERQQIVGTRTGRRFSVGQTVAVQLTDVSLARLEVNLRLVEKVEKERRKRAS